MTRFWPVVPASLTLLVAMNTAQAAPLRPELTIEPFAMIEKVHGTHRSCVYSPARGWHRHVSRYNRAVGCGYPYYYDSPFYDPFWGSPGITFWFGPSPRYYRDRPYRYYRYRRVQPRWDGDRRRR
jgi:hypothetical protein